MTEKKAVQLILDEDEYGKPLDALVYEDGDASIELRAEDTTKDPSEMVVIEIGLNRLDAVIKFFNVVKERSENAKKNCATKSGN